MLDNIIDIKTRRPWRPKIDFKPDANKSDFENAIDEYIATEITPANNVK